MAVKKLPAMYSPTQQSPIADEGTLPLYSPAKAPLHMKMEADDCTDGGYWIPSVSQLQPLKGEEGLPMWSSSSGTTMTTAAAAAISQNGNPSAPPGFSDDGSVHAIPNIPKRAPILVVGFLLVGLAAVWTSRSAVNHASEQVTLLEKNRSRMDSQMQRSQKELHVLRREITAMDSMIQQQLEKGVSNNSKGNGPDAASLRALNEVTAIRNRLKDEKNLKDVLKKQVQTVSLHEVNQKYGKGAHRVQIELAFPDKQVGPDHFVIELAPTELMPHSIYTFLEMVSTGLLDGCSFILNALHVVKAAPLPYDGSSAAEKAKAFAERGLESVAFKEYSDSFPHKRYTVGFAADGSPSFYINTEDNTDVHKGDPCFGKVIEGFDTIRRLEGSPTRNGIWFEQRIGIKSAKILTE